MDIGLPLSPESLPFEGVVAATAATLLVWLAGRSRARRAATPLRLALADADPETRRAAVLVAACHGVDRHARLLLERVGVEDAPCVLVAVVEAVRGDRSTAASPAVRALQAWADGFPALPAGPEVELVEALPATASALAEPSRWVVDGVDALEVLEAVASVASLAPPGPERGEVAATSAAGRWRGRWGELDADEVVAAVVAVAAGRASGGTERPRSTRRRRRPNVDIDSLLDELVGIDLGEPRLARARGAASG